MQDPDTITSYQFSCLPVEYSNNLRGHICEFYLLDMILSLYFIEYRSKKDLQTTFIFFEMSVVEFIVEKE